MDNQSILNAVQDQNGAVALSELSNESQAVHDGLANVLNQFDANAYAASVRVYALKPASESVIPKPKEETNMKTIQVYDKPMCCSTGVCGPEVDAVLPRFAADLQWLKSLGHRVERFNLAQQPEAFIENSAVHQLLAVQGTTCLPLIAVDGEIVSRQAYPTRDDLTHWISSERQAASGCCGGPAKDPSKSCCAADESAKGTTGSGCGCSENAVAPAPSRAGKPACC